MANVESHKSQLNSARRFLLKPFRGLVPSLQQVGTLMNVVLLTYPVWDIIYTLDYRILGLSLPINQIARLLIMLYMLIQIRDIRHLCVLGVSAVLLGIAELTYWRYAVPGLDIMQDLSYDSKLLLFLVALYFFQEKLATGSLRERDVIRALAWSGGIIAGSIILSVFGLGLHSWSTGLRSGFKGLFTVQNTVTATSLIILPLVLYMFSVSRHRGYLVAFVIFGLATCLTGTKAGLGGTIVITIVLLPWALKHISSPDHVAKLALQNKLCRLVRYMKVPPRYRRLVTYSLAGVVTVAVGSVAVHFLTNYIRQQEDLYVLYGYKHLYSFLISNRDLQLAYALRFISAHYRFQPCLLFGIGYSVANSAIHAAKADFNAIEMDGVGIYVYSGVWVLIGIALVILRRVVCAVRWALQERSFESVCLLVAVLMGLFHSTFGGHVIYEALTSMYFAAVLSIARVRMARVLRCTLT